MTTVCAADVKNGTEEVQDVEEHSTTTFPNTANNRTGLLLDVRPGLLLGSAQLPGRPHASSCVRALMLSQTLAINEALPALAALVGSLPRVKPLVHLQFLDSGVSFATDAADIRSVDDVGLIMCDQVRVHAEPLPADGAGERSLLRVLHLVYLQ